MPKAETAQVARLKKTISSLVQQINRLKDENAALEMDLKSAGDDIVSKRQFIDRTLTQRNLLQEELIGNCGAVRVEYSGVPDEKPVRVLWHVDPVTGVATHRANAKYAAEVQARAMKAEAEAEKLTAIIVKLAQVIEALSGEERNVSAQ